MSNRNSFIESTKETDERLEALKQLYPEIFSDGKINLDAFKDVTGTSDLPEGQDKTPGYYGLYWPGKRAAKQLARKEAEGTLEPVFGDGVNEDTTHNIYIEGDNLEVLRILKQSYKGRVKMIYIDPPYNTGNDFIYPDDFKMPVEEYLKLTGQVDEGGKKLVTNLKSNGAFHTNWLNMMYPRLQIARELLTQDGVIFISIDDNEQSNLKLLCDDLFGEENFCGIFPWRKRTAKSDVPFGISQDYEYVLIYAKSSEFSASIEGKERKYYETEDFPGKPWRVHDLTKQTSASERPNSFFTIVNPKTKEEYPANPNRTWAITKETFEEYYKANRIVFPGDYDFLQISKPALRYWKEDDMAKAGDNFGKIPVSTKLPEEIGMSQDGTKEITEVFGTKVFSFPKPASLIKYFEKVSTNKDSNQIILDFFSGSASTAQAAMDLNKEDNGNRKFIMVQLPHKCEDNSEAAKAGYSNICEIGKERIRRAGTKILEEVKTNKDMFNKENPLDVGFKVYRMTKSNFKKYTPVSGQDKEAEKTLFKELEENLVPLVEGWKSENVLTEIILKQGFALDCTKEKVDSFKKNTIWKITDSADAISKKIKLYVCLDNSIEEETIKNLTLNDDEKFICLDAAIDDSAYARLADKGRIETI